VWGDPGVWSNTVVWGNSLLTSTGGSPLGPTTVVWGNLDAGDW
jgi:hypothetical protein